MIQRRRNEIGRSLRGLTIIVLVGGLLGGCTTLPDTSGFTAATIQVKQAVATAGNVVETELKAAGTVSREDVEAFQKAWKTTVASLDAMIKYAESIEQIVDAGNNGKESANQVADSVKKFAEAVKVDATTGAAAEVLGVTTDSVAFIYGEIAKIRAADNLDQALSKAGPGIVKINTVIQAQVEDARRLFYRQSKDQIQNLKTGGPEGYGDWLKTNKAIRKKQRESVILLRKELEKEDWDLTKLQDKLVQVKKTRDQIAPDLAEYEEKLSEIRKREKAGLNVLRATENAIAEWGTAHQKLVLAVKERKPVSVESLTVAVGEIRILIGKWGEL